MHHQMNNHPITSSMITAAANKPNCADRLLARPRPLFSLCIVIADDLPEISAIQQLVANEYARFDLCADPHTIDLRQIIICGTRWLGHLFAHQATLAKHQFLCLRPENLWVMRRRMRFSVECFSSTMTHTREALRVRRALGVVSIWSSPPSGMTWC